MICAYTNVQQTSAARVARTTGRAGRKVRGAREMVKPWMMRMGMGVLFVHVGAYFGLQANKS